MKLNTKLILVSLLYFAEGFPLGIIELTLPIYFLRHGMSLVHIGLLSLLSLPYALKLCWAPAVDFLGTRRRWIAGAQLLMAACILLLLPLDPSKPSTLLWLVLASLAICSATQDIAIDAYTIELLESSEIGIANGFRQAAYRVALVVAGGLFVASGGWIGWELTFTCAAGLLIVCGVCALQLPPVEVPRPPAGLIVALVAPVRDLVARPGVIQVACFILLYKLGDLSMGPMVRPFWLARGLSDTEIGLITGTFGVIASIAGGLAGGLFMVRFGIFHGLWFLGIWQSASNLTYAWVAATEATKWGVYGASFVESFCSGLGTAAFLAFLMSICRKEFSATQYAVLSGLFKIAGIIAGSLSGWATRSLGFGAYFTLTFFLSLPAFLFLFQAKKWIPADPHRDSGPPLLDEASDRGDDSKSGVARRGIATAGYR